LQEMTNPKDTTVNVNLDSNSTVRTSKGISKKTAILIHVKIIAKDRPPE